MSRTAEYHLYFSSLPEFSQNKEIELSPLLYMEGARLRGKREKVYLRPLGEEKLRDKADTIITITQANFDTYLGVTTERISKQPDSDWQENETFGVIYPTLEERKRLAIKEYLLNKQQNSNRNEADTFLVRFSEINSEYSGVSDGRRYKVDFINLIVGHALQGGISPLELYTVTTIVPDGISKEDIFSKFPGGQKIDFYGEEILEIKMPTKENTGPLYEKVIALYKQFYGNEKVNKNHLEKVLHYLELKVKVNIHPGEFAYEYQDPITGMIYCIDWRDNKVPIARMFDNLADYRHWKNTIQAQLLESGDGVIVAYSPLGGISAGTSKLKPTKKFVNYFVKTPGGKIYMANTPSALARYLTPPLAPYPHLPALYPRVPPPLSSQTPMMPPRSPNYLRPPMSNKPLSLGMILPFFSPPLIPRQPLPTPKNEISHEPSHQEKESPSKGNPFQVQRKEARDNPLDQFPFPKPSKDEKRNEPLLEGISDEETMPIEERKQQKNTVKKVGESGIIFNKVEERNSQGREIILAMSLMYSEIPLKSPEGDGETSVFESEVAQSFDQQSNTVNNRDVAPAPKTITAPTKTASNSQSENTTQSYLNTSFRPQSSHRRGSNGITTTKEGTNMKKSDLLTQKIGESALSKKGIPQIIFPQVAPLVIQPQIGARVEIDWNSSLGGQPPLWKEEGFYWSKMQGNAQKIFNALSDPSVMRVLGLILVVLVNIITTRVTA